MFGSVQAEPGVNRNNGAVTQGDTKTSMKKKDTAVQEWVAAERAAAAAEGEVAKMGQAAATPEAVALLKRARALRLKADKLYRGVNARADV